MEGEEKPLKLYFIPYLASGHMIPLCDIARLFASRGHHVTVITTPFNAKVLHKSNPYQQHFHIHTFPFPSQEVGLPDGIENLSAVSDLDNSYKVYQATVVLRSSIETFVEKDPPDCIVADFLYPWVDDLANKLRIPRLSFNGFSLFTICAMEAVKKLPIASYDSFTIPDFPHDDITINASPPEYARGFLEPLLEVLMKSDGLIVNNFAELDGEEYIEYYHKATGRRAWHLGPACLIRTTAQEKAERGQQSVARAKKELIMRNY
ncbi:hypothetical protein RIF29_08130 [Crotalaria pallida]|uniref:Uncharacterized protein n=1 Tax=Crotalaria pallida TaxID=3830 RepID=A0AAN9PCF0_CROPI